jgi:GNAT superfamily N-acetyltransferase
MSSRKVLIDTNVFIGLEDQREVVPEFALMLQACSRHAVRVFVHGAAVADIQRDPDAARRRVSLSKINKFEALIGIAEPCDAELAARFGPINRPNDRVDVALIYALELGAVDFLITQDLGIHTRARRRSPALAQRVLTVAEMVTWLRATYEPQEVRLPLVQDVKAHSIPLNDDIFESLRDGYPDFDRWWRQKCVAEHRPCWAVTINGELAGLVVRKDETHVEAKTRNEAQKILKICTFKVKPKFRGEKLGELLLKQALWFAQKNRYDLTYVTTYPDQIFLIRILEYFGFEMTGKNDTGENVYEKPLFSVRLQPCSGANLFELARANYPRFVADPPAEAFCVPVRGEYHNVLFPEMALRSQPDLFEIAGLAVPGVGPRTPGNTIRKVYLCRARTKALSPGAILIFYRSKSPGYIHSQCATSVGVVEAVYEASSLDELVRLTAKRSVYSTRQLQNMVSHNNEVVKVIDFLLVGHLDPPATLDDLLREKVFCSHPPQSICQLPPERLAPLKRRMNFGFAV